MTCAARLSAGILCLCLLFPPEALSQLRAAVRPVGGSGAGVAAVGALPASLSVPAGLSLRVSPALQSSLPSLSLPAPAGASHVETLFASPAPLTPRAAHAPLSRTAVAAGPWKSPRVLGAATAAPSKTAAAPLIGDAASPRSSARGAASLPRLLGRIGSILRPKSSRRIAPASLDRLFSRASGRKRDLKPAAVEAGRLQGGRGLKGRWLPENRRRLERLIEEYGRGGSKWDPSSPPLAVFDWDNTMIRNDIGEAVFYHAIRDMRFKFDRGDAFWELIPEALGRRELRSSYEEIKHLPLKKARKTRAYRRYRKLFHAVYEGIKENNAKYNVDYSWLVQLMAGFTPSELRRFTDEVIAEELARPMGVEVIQEGPGDREPVVIPAGIRFYPEMLDLVERLREAGWEVRIVSATSEWSVRRFAKRAGFPLSLVHGVKVRVRKGRLTREVTQPTWGEGKARVVLRKAGRPSRLSGGDNNIDVPLLRLSTGERLVIDRGREPLRSIAESEGWILQPRFED